MPLAKRRLFCIRYFLRTKWKQTKKKNRTNDEKSGIRTAINETLKPSFFAVKHQHNLKKVNDTQRSTTLHQTLPKSPQSTRVSHYLLISSLNILYTINSNCNNSQFFFISHCIWWQYPISWKPEAYHQKPKSTSHALWTQTSKASAMETTVNSTLSW